MRSTGSFARRSFVARSSHQAAARAVVESVEPRRLLAAVTGVVFDDINSNGRRDGNEAGLATSIVFADYNYDGQRGSDEQMATTNTFGQYTLNVDLRAFALRTNAIGATTQTFPANAAPHYYEVRNGQLVGIGADFGLHIANAPQDPQGQRLLPYVYVDANNNGQRDAGESGPAGQTIFADYDYDGVRDADEPGAVTNASGIAEIHVAARSFALRLITANGVTQLTPANNGPQFFVPATTSISGTLYDDTNKNGQRDGGEGSVSYDYSFGYYVLYIDLNNNGHPDDNEPTATTRRDAVDSGAYRFDNLPVGRSYTVGFAFSPAATSSLYVTGQGGLSNRRTVAATSAAPTSGVDFGFALGVHVTPLVFPDLNGNGVKTRMNRPGLQSIPGST